MVLADEPAPVAADDAIADEDDAVGAAAAVLDEPELQAAAPRAMPAAAPETASRRRFFMMFSLLGFQLPGISVEAGPRRGPAGFR
jgi:hypothetical protein